MPTEMQPGRATGDSTRATGAREPATRPADRVPEARDEPTIVVTAAPEPGLLAGWDTLVASIAHADVAQLSGWAALRAHAGYEPLYLLALSESSLLGGGLLLRRTVRGVGQVGYMAYGPVLSPSRPGGRRLARRRLVGALASTARRPAAVFVQPPDGGDDIALEMLQHGFRLSQAAIAPAATLRIDLTRTEDQLRAALNRRLRTWTRQWARHGVRVRVGGREDIPLLTRLAAATARFQGFSPYPRSYLEAAHHELAPGGHLLLLVAELAGRPVAAELFSAVGDVLKSRLTGMDRTAEHAGEVLRLNVTSALIWEALRWGRANGYRTFDFGGVRPESVPALLRPGPPDQDALARQDVFKTKFGGELALYPPAVERIHSPLLRAGYDALHRAEGGRRLISFAREHLRGTRALDAAAPLVSGE
jgi:lipid II:glycine glycyltransferase (peptidoglycan interpeptide bridge formation enzyme)